MLLRFYTICIFLLLCEAATKIGLGNGRPSEEPSSLKTEVLKFKTSECGGTSSEEPTKKKQKNRQKNHDDDDEDEDSEEDKKNRRRNKGRNRGRGFREEYMVYGRSYEDNRQFGLGRRDDYNNRQDNPFQQRWDEPYNNRNRNQYTPYYGNNEDEFFPQNNNRRNNNNHRDRDRDGFNQRPGNFNNHRDRYNQEEDRYNDRDDRHSNRKKPNNHNDWDDTDDDDYDRKKNRRQNNRNNRNQNKRGKKRKNKEDNTDGECISQCVFNNMQIMEDDGIPSEAGLIKWAQEKIKNEKLKQTAVKEIRRCFGTLASSDGENSCNFSKSLANCLKLGLDEEKE